MTELTRPDIVAGLAAEQAAFADLVAGLDMVEWSTETRCEGWQVRDIAGHVTGNAVDSVAGTIGARSPEEQARALRGGTPDELATVLRDGAAGLRALLESLDDSSWGAPSPAPGRTIGAGVLTLWYDTFVHADDVRAALGRAERPERPERTEPGLAATVRWIRDELERLGRGPLTIALDGLPAQSVGTGGPLATGDPMRFVLAATGRCDPAVLGLDESINVHSLR